MSIKFRLKYFRFTNRRTSTEIQNSIIDLLLLRTSNRFCFYRGHLEELEECQETITAVIEAHKRIFNSSTFRNNLFHYKLSTEIDPSLSNNYFETMVETLTSVSLENLLATVYKEMDIAEKLIKEIIY